MTGLMERLDDIPRPAWIALVVLSFIVFWPVGLALLIYLKWSGRMFCSRHGRYGHWYGAEDRQGGREARDLKRIATLVRLTNPPRLTRWERAGLRVIADFSGPYTRAGLIYVRYLLHHALLEEAAHMGFAETVCPNCHMHIVASGFCPNCGMALTAAPTSVKRARKPVAAK